MKSGLLVASPQMVDPFFGRAVILLCEHGVDGTMGLVVNRPIGIQLETVLDQLGVKRPESMPDPVLWGGPVMPEAGFLVCRGDASAYAEAMLEVTDRIFVSSSRTMLEQAAQGALDQPFYLCLGYAGWGPGQLDAEIQRGTWIVLDLDEDIVFSTALEDRWEKSIESLGISADQIWMNNPVEE